MDFDFTTLEKVTKAAKLIADVKNAYEDYRVADKICGDVILSFKDGEWDSTKYFEVSDASRKAASEVKKAIRRVMKFFGVETIYTSWGESVKNSSTAYAWGLGYNQMVYHYGHGCLTGEERDIIDMVGKMCGNVVIKTI